jgi:hypothetical protein
MLVALVTDFSKLYQCYRLSLLRLLKKDGQKRHLNTRNYIVSSLMFRFQNFINVNQDIQPLVKEALINWETHPCEYNS